MSSDSCHRLSFWDCASSMTRVSYSELSTFATHSTNYATKSNTYIPVLNCVLLWGSLRYCPPNPVAYNTLMMPEYLAPGVYVEGTSFVHGPIAPSPTSIAAFVGATAKGPLHNPTHLNNIAAYRESFGLISPACPLSLSVFQFFSNGGRRAIVIRTASVSADSRGRATKIVGDAAKGTGIHALGNSPSVGLLLTPDVSAMGLREHSSVTQSVLTFCEKHRIFHLVDAPQSRSRRNRVDTVITWAKRSGAMRHPNAAVYFPRIRMSDPSGKSNSILVAASGAVAGVYARTDSQRGVWTPPAGMKARLLGTTDVEFALSESQMERLQSASINPVRSFPGHGILAWGARTFAPGGSRSEWKYVSVRRMFLFIESSVEEGLRWVVFEPNDEALWAQIRLSISSFLNHLFRHGAFPGASTREAYFVRCGRDTMTQDDIRGGRVIAEVGFAPLKPAEFVLLRLGLGTAESN